MAEKKKTKQPSRRMWLVDPIYRKFTAKAFQQLTSPEFFEFFMSMMKNGEQQFQFSNRKLKIDIDETWISIIEDTIPAFLEITRNPRVIITQEELITNVVQARKIDSQVVRHLCAHSNLIDAIDENGDVIPGKVLNIFKEESWDTYENRFVYTLLKKTYDFVAKRYQDMKEAMNDEFGANLLIDATAFSKMETIEVHTAMKIRQIDELDDADPTKKSAFSRVAYLYQTLNQLLQTRFAKEMAKYSLVYPPLVSTNAIKKNPFLRKCHALWNFLLHYSEAGFTVEIIEQNPEINQKFEQDIVDNIMFTYIILKGYLEDNRDRALDRTVKARRRELRPKYIKEIIEEVVRDFNLSEVEVRKVLLEELTKEDLMREEREERYRLAEERRRLMEQKRREEEMERARLQKEREREARRRAREREKEKARIEREKKKEAERLEKEKEKKALADAKRLDIMEEELQRQMENVERLRAKKNKTPKKKTAGSSAAKTKKTMAASKKTTAKPTTKTAAKPVHADTELENMLERMIEEEKFASDFGNALSSAERQEAWRAISLRNHEKPVTAKPDTSRSDIGPVMDPKEVTPVPEVVELEAAAEPLPADEPVEEEKTGKGAGARLRKLLQRGFKK